MKQNIINFLQILLNSKFYIVFVSQFKPFDKLSRYNKSAPRVFKQKLFQKYNFSDGAWIETGTHLGNTTEYLSKIAKCVYTIEPSEMFFNSARETLSSKKNIKLIHGTSEEYLEKVISKIKNKNISFWLDGHYSGGDTFEGEDHSPVLHELEIIEKYLYNFKKVNILIDDFRIFNNHYPKSSKINYPNQSELINWVKKNNLKWSVKKNIFIINFKYNS